MVQYRKLRREAVVREEERRQQAAKIITKVRMMVVIMRIIIGVKTAAKTIQRYWRHAAVDQDVPFRPWTCPPSCL